MVTRDKSSDAAIPSGCPLDRVLRMLSGEWTTHILWVLSNNGPTRHGELQRLLDGISSKVLTERLRMLEAQGVVAREHEQTIPPKVTYRLTEAGRHVDTALRAIEQVARDWRQAE